MLETMYKKLNEAEINQNSIIITISTTVIKLSEHIIEIDNLCAVENKIYLHSKEGYYIIPINNKIEKLYEDEEEVDYKIKIGEELFLDIKIIK